MPSVPSSRVRPKSLREMASAALPRTSSRIGTSTSQEKVVRVCDRMRGSMGDCAAATSWCVKAALPRLAVSPQSKPAAAM